MGNDLTRLRSLLEGLGILVDYEERPVRPHLEHVPDPLRHTLSGVLYALDSMFVFGPLGRYEGRVRFPSGRRPQWIEREPEEGE